MGVSLPARGVYLDYAATTPVRTEVLEVMLPHLRERYGNPASLHALGVEARETLERAKSGVAAGIGALPEEILFTSGGTEADNLAIQGIGLANLDRGNHIVTSAVEHAAVLHPCQYLERMGFRVTHVPVDRFGMIHPEEVRKRLTSKTILISIMHANNEIGTLQPLREIGSMARERGIIFHTDAVQTVGKVPLRVKDFPVDALSLSAHKMCGPKGVGALFIRKGVKIRPLLFGGGQERGLRSGTENVAGITGLAKAMELALEERESETERLVGLRQALFKGLAERVEGLQMNGHPLHRLPGNLHLSFPGIDGRELLRALDGEGIFVSRGSACSSFHDHPSHVLKAIGLPDALALGSIRFTAGLYTTPADVQRVLQVLPALIEEGRKPGRRGARQAEAFQERMRETARTQGCESLRQLAWSHVSKKILNRIFRRG
jgi:cysteine desulfurase